MYIRARLQKSPCSASADNTVWKDNPFHIHQPALAVCRLSAQAWAAGFYPVSLALLKFLAVLVRPRFIELVLRHDGPGYVPSSGLCHVHDANYHVSKLDLCATELRASEVTVMSGMGRLLSK